MKLIRIIKNWFEYQRFVYMRQHGLIWDYGLNKWVKEPPGMYTAAYLAARKETK